MIVDFVDVNGVKFIFINWIGMAMDEWHWTIDVSIIHGHYDKTDQNIYFFKYLVQDNGNIVEYVFIYIYNVLFTI